VLLGNFTAALGILPRHEAGRFALSSRVRFYLAADILKFGLLFKFRPAVRRSAKFKKRKQILLSYSPLAQ